jgi:hypothetical protein
MELCDRIGVKAEDWKGNSKLNKQNNQIKICPGILLDIILGSKHYNKRYNFKIYATETQLLLRN